MNQFASLFLYSYTANKSLVMDIRQNEATGHSTVTGQSTKGCTEHLSWWRWLLFEGWCMAGWLLSEGLQCWYNDTLLPATARAGRLKPDLGPGAVPGPGHHDSVTHIRDAECGPPHVITSWHTQPPSSDRQIQQIEISTTKYVVNLY